MVNLFSHTFEFLWASSSFQKSALDLLVITSLMLANGAGLDLATFKIT